MKDQVIYMESDSAMELLVDRIDNRVKAWGYCMTQPEKDAMAGLISSAGVTIDQILDIDSMAANYAVNAQIVTPEDYHNFEESELEDCLFSWEYKGKTFYCLSW